MRRSLGLILTVLAASLASPAAAMVGPSQPGQGAALASVMIVGSRGNFCTGSLIAPDLVLTAAHCVPPGADYKLVEFDAARQPTLRDTAAIERHPQFDMRSFLNHRATADVALVKLGTALRKPIASLHRGALAVAHGDAFVIAGFGLSEHGNGKTGGSLRMAELVATGKPGNLQIRLVDPTTKNEAPGAGACTGDSGGPVFLANSQPQTIIGVVSWSTAARNTDGCGGLTGVTPLSLYVGWIAQAAKRLGSPLAQ